MDDFHCSFCGKARLDVRKLISGPRVFICNECVAKARQFMGPAPAPAAPEPPLARKSDAFLQAEGIRRRQTMGFIDTATAQAQLVEAYGVPFTDLEHLAIPEQVLRLIPRAVAVEHRLIPIARAGNMLTVAMVDPNNAAVAAARGAAGLDIDVTVADMDALLRLLDLHYPPPPREGPSCSFCGKPKSDVAKMVAGSGIHICDECIVLCEDIIAALDQEETA